MSGGTIPFAPDTAVEIVAGDARGLRGRYLGEARSMYLGVPDVVVKVETGREIWIRGDFLRVLR